jgi:hypothetical protein
MHRLDLSGVHTAEKLTQNTIIIDESLGPNKFNFRSDFADTRAKALAIFPEAPVGSMITGPGVKFVRVAVAGVASDFKRISTQVHWEDLRFPAQGINPPGAVSDPDVELTTGMLLFAPNATEVVMGVAQMPHAWKEGSVIVPHVHWQKTTSAPGDVLWRFNYDTIVNPGEVSPLTYLTEIDALTPVAGTPDDNTAGRNLISSFGEVEMTDKRISTCILWRLARIGGNAADTYGADARLVEFDIHYQTDQDGSELEFVKHSDI